MVHLSANKSTADYFTSLTVITPELDDLLSLLVLMIHADKRVVKDEIATFTRLTDKLQAARNVEPRLSPARLLSWYGENTDFIAEKMESPDFETWFYERLEALDHIEDKLPILCLLCDIASSDGVIHVGEIALIKLVAEHWELEI